MSNDADSQNPTQIDITGVTTAFFQVHVGERFTLVSHTSCFLAYTLSCLPGLRYVPSARRTAAQWANLYRGSLRLRDPYGMRPQGILAPLLALMDARANAYERPEPIREILQILGQTETDICAPKAGLTAPLPVPMGCAGKYVYCVEFVGPPEPPDEILRVEIGGMTSAGGIDEVL